MKKEAKQKQKVRMPAAHDQPEPRLHRDADTAIAMRKAAIPASRTVQIKKRMIKPSGMSGA
jgi:hypothetical protein